MYVVHFMARTRPLCVNRVYSNGLDWQHHHTARIASTTNPELFFQQLENIRTEVTTGAAGQCILHASRPVRLLVGVTFSTHLCPLLVSLDTVLPLVVGLSCHK